MAAAESVDHEPRGDAVATRRGRGNDRGGGGDEKGRECQRRGDAAASQSEETRGREAGRGDAVATRRGNDRGDAGTRRAAGARGRQGREGRRQGRCCGKEATRLRENEMGTQAARGTCLAKELARGIGLEGGGAGRTRGEWGEFEALGLAAGPKTTRDLRAARNQKDARKKKKKREIVFRQGLVNWL